MAFELKNVVPWGRSFDEYKRMFSLTEEDLSQHLLGCGDGPASFNSEGTKKGINIISADPVYQFTRQQLEQRIEEVRREIMTKTRLHKDQFLWNYFKSPDDLEIKRLNAMANFLEDYDLGKSNGRYIHASLPSLPFQDKQFDLSLVSHLLFLYSEILDYHFHVSAVRELVRVSHEVRIFPLLDLTVTTSEHIEPLMKEQEWDIRLEKVDYEFQKGGNQMMVIKAK